MTTTVEPPRHARAGGFLYSIRRRAFSRPYSRVRYVIERKGWSIDWDGRYITQEVSRQTGVDCRTARTAKGIFQQIVHFGSRHLYFSGGFQRVDQSNRVVVTWFHGSDTDPHPENQRMIQMLPDRAASIDRMVTTSTIGESRLIGWGVPPSKIARIPLGVALSVFRPALAGECRRVRARLGIPEEAVCIGSFQKDGNGWGKGMSPKRIKGPDLLLEVAGQLAKRYPLYVLLLGPARGYVAQGLTERGIRFQRRYVRDYEAIAPYYHALDLYLVTSRDEGGPKTVLESMASGVPVVSTRVGMAADIIRHEENGYLANVEDVEGLTTAVSALIEHPQQQAQCVQRALETVKAYDWPAIARQYYEQVYQPLLS